MLSSSDNGRGLFGVEPSIVTPPRPLTLGFSWRRGDEPLQTGDRLDDGAVYPPRLSVWAR